MKRSTIEDNWKKNIVYLASCSIALSIGYMVGYAYYKEENNSGGHESFTGTEKSSYDTGRLPLERALLDFGTGMSESKKCPSFKQASLQDKTKDKVTKANQGALAASPPQSRKHSSTASVRKTKQPPSILKDRVLIVMFRLPLTLSKDSAGNWTVKWNSISEPMANFRFLQEEINFTWVGWPGVDVPKEEFTTVEEVLKQYNCVPVWINTKLRKKMYRGFCKTVLWPLFHYQVSRSEEQFKNHDDLFRAYETVNLLFAKKAAEFEAGPMIWFHNYHLLLAPTFMRRSNPQAKIGLFIHTTFPTSEVFRCLPNRLNLIRGIINSDVIGFHTYNYARHFISTSKRLLNLEFETLEGGSLGVQYNGRRVELQVNHVGIESVQIAELASSDTVQHQAEKFREKYRGLKIIVSVDELDVIKGTILKIQAFKHFIEIHQEWIGEIVFLQILKPTSNIDALRNCREAVLEAISEIREKFGEEIIHVFEERPSLERLLSFYRAADVAVFSTFWDGFNIDPHEFTAAQFGRKEPGVLILSEFMGCSRSLSGVFRVNPWKMSEVAKAIHSAVVLGTQEKLIAHERRYKYVMTYDFRQWVNCFISDLKRHSAFSDNKVWLEVGMGSQVRLIYLPCDYLPLKDHEDRLVKEFCKAKKRLLLFDYGGTLVDESGFVKGRPLSPETLSYLQRLSADPNNCVAIITAKSRSELSQTLKDVKNLCLFAEKGAFLRWPGADSFVRSPDINDTSSYKKIACDIMSKYLKKTDGAAMREQEAVLVWSWENTDPDYGEMQAGELEKYLQRLLKHYPAVVTKYHHSKKIEVAPQSCNKYDATLRILNHFQKKVEKSGVTSLETFLFCCGNSRSDEEMFSVVEKVGKKWCPDSHFTCSVGIKPSNAKYYVGDTIAVNEMLCTLAQSM